MMDQAELIIQGVAIIPKTASWSCQFKTGVKRTHLHYSDSYVRGEVSHETLRWKLEIGDRNFRTNEFALFEKELFLLHNSDVK